MTRSRQKKNVCKKNFKLDLTLDQSDTFLQFGRPSLLNHNSNKGVCRVHNHKPYLNKYEDTGQNEY